MTEQAAIRILSVDDHLLLREGIAAIIQNQPGMILVSQASSSVQAVQQHRDYRPDVTLMDLRLPDASGIDTMIAIRAEAPDARIIVLTTFADDEEIQLAFDAGACAYLLKSMPPDEMVDVIRQVHAGKTRIAPASAGQVRRENLPEPPVAVREPEGGSTMAGALSRGMKGLLRAFRGR